MATYDNETGTELFSPPPAGPMFAPQPTAPGIGLTAAAPPPMGASSLPTPRSTVEEGIGNMGTLGRIGVGLQEFGAGVLGKESPMAQRIEQQRRGRAQQLQEFQQRMQAIDYGVNKLKGMAPEDQDAFKTTYGRMLDELHPGSSEALKAGSKFPDLTKALSRYQGIPALEESLAADRTGNAFFKKLEQKDYRDMVQQQLDQKILPPLKIKVGALVDEWKRAGDPAQVKQFMADGVLDEIELRKINEVIGAHPQFQKLALDNADWAAADRHRKDVFQPLGIRTAEEAAKLRDTAAGKDGTIRKVQVGEKEVTQEFKNGAWTTIAEGPKFARSVAPIVNVERQPQWQEIEDPLKAGSFIKVNPAQYDEARYKAGDKTGVLGKGKSSADSKPLPAGALKMQQEALDGIGTARNISTDIGSIKAQLDSGALDLGVIKNPTAEIKNWAGFSNESSRNLASFKATLEKMRNDSLRLNKGVQTEGDAQRAWKELLSTINDPKLVAQRLDEIQNINNRAAELRKLDVNLIRSNYGHPELDVSKYETQPAAVGADKGSPPARRASDGLPPTNAKGWKLMTDAKGRKAYVGPNKEIEEVSQ